VLQAARRSGRSLSELREQRVRRPQLNVNVRMDERRDLATWEDLQAKIAEQEEILGPGGRFVVRYSGTEPLLRVMAEGREEDAVVRAVEAVADVARNA
jgi:phosphoglucosamine mutase